MSSLDESDQFGQLTSDFIDNKNNIYKTKGTFIHLIKNVNNNVYQVNDILNNQLFDIPLNYFKKVEYTDLPNDVQQLIPPSSLNHKKKRSVTTLFSKFRTSKSSKSTTTTTSTTTSSNNNYFNNNIKSNSNSNTNTGSNTSLLDNTSSNNSSSNYNNNTIKLTTFDDNTTINSSGGGSVGDTSQDDEDEDDLDSDEDDVILQDRTNSFCKPSSLLNHHQNNSGSSGRLNSISAPPSIALPSLDLPPPSSSISNNSNNSTTLTIVSPKLSIYSSSNQIKIELNSQQKEQLSIKLLKYYYKKQFKEYINKSPQVRQARLRKAALLEILTTEQTYFNSLLTCKQLFMDPLLNEAQTKKKPTLTLSDINDIFGELPNIMQASQLLMTDLKKEIDKWPTHPILIGNIFKSFAPFFRMYSKYINNFDSVAEKVEKLEKTSKSFSQFLIKTHEMPECCGLTFLSYLVCPVQRVPRIRMLLQEVIRRTDETHIDYQLLEQALLIVNQVAENLNESKRIAENDKIVFDLQEKMKGRFNNLLQAHRKFTTCFNSIHVESSKEIEKKRLYGFYNIYLFNDMLLIVPINSSNNNNNNSSGGSGFGSGIGSGSSNNSSLSNLNDQSSSDSSSNLYNSEYEEERNRIARESFIFSLAFSKVKDKSLKDNNNDLNSNSQSIESTSNSIQLLKLSSITNNSIGKFIFIMDTFIKTQQVKLTFSFNSQLQRDEMEAEVSLNIEQLDSKNEKLFSKSKLKIENKRIEHVKLIKSNDMILSKNLLQKHVASEKLKEVSDRLITCELELEVKLQYYKNYKEEYSKQYEKLEQIYQKESESLIEYEEQVQRIIQIDDTICKMLNHDIDTFRELFMDDPRNLLDQDYDMITTSPSLLSSSIGGGGSSMGGNSLSIGNTTAIYDITGSNGPLTSQSNNNNSSNSNNNNSMNNMNQQNTRSTISFDNSNDNSSSSFDNSSSSSSRKQTILPTRKMFNSAAALNLGILDGSSSSRDSSLPLKQLKDSCNPYIQQAYKELRRKTFSSNNIINNTNTNNNNTNNNSNNNLDNDNDEEVEVFNTLYRIRPNRKWYMMEPIKKLPNKYSIDRLLHGENTPQDIVPKIYPYPEEYNDPDMYYDKISHRDGFYNEEEEEMFSNNNYNNHLNDFDELNQDEFKSFNRNYSNYFDLPSNVDELRTMIIKLQFEKEDLRNDVSKLKQQLSSINNTSNSNNNSTPSTPYSATMMMNNNEFNSPQSSSSLPPLTTSTTFSNNNITSPSTQSKQQQQPTEYIASDFIDEYIE